MHQHDAPTELLPDYIPTQDANALAYSQDVTPELHTWRTTWGHTAILTAITVAITFAVVSVGTAVMSGLRNDVESVVPKTHRATIDDKFVASLDAQQVQVTNSSGAVEAGHLVCFHIDNGESQAEILQKVRMSNPEKPDDQLIRFINTAVETYCPGT